MARTAQLLAGVLLSLLAPGCVAVAQGVITLDNYTFDKMLAHPGWSFLVKFDKTHAHGDKENAFKELAKMSSAVPDFFVTEVPVQDYGSKDNVALRERFGFGKDDMPCYIFLASGDKSGLKYKGEIQADLLATWLRGLGIKMPSIGTIEELDALVRKFIGSSFADEHLAQAKKLVAEDFKSDKKAPVYLRIMEKLKEAGDVGYLDKELKRVSSVLAQKNTPEKVSELSEKLKILAGILEKDPSDLPAADSLEVVFFKGATSKEQTVVFKRKPLGMHFEQKLPLKVKSVQDHAKALGVEAGWEVKTLGGSEIAGLEYAEVMDLLKIKVGLLAR